MNVDLLIKENKELNEEKQRYKKMWLTTNNLLSKYRKLEEQLDCPLEVVIEHINESYKILCQHIKINEKYIELKKYRDMVELSKISNDIALSKEQKGLCKKYFTWLKKDESE